MNINAVQSQHSSAQTRQRAERGSSGASFSELLQNRAAPPATASGGAQKEYNIYSLDEDMLASYAVASGLSFYIKYAENSTKENPSVIAKGIDENGNDFEETIYLNDVDPHNATVTEFKALEAHITGNRGGISRNSAMLGMVTHDMGRNDRANFIDALDQIGKGQIQVGEEENAQLYFDLLEQFLAYVSAHK